MALKQDVRVEPVAETVGDLGRSPARTNRNSWPGTVPARLSARVKWAGLTDRMTHGQPIRPEPAGRASGASTLARQLMLRLWKGQRRASVLMAPERS